MRGNRNAASSVRAVAVVVLVAGSALALRSHIPAGEQNPFAGAIATPAVLAIAVAVLGVALFVIIRTHARPLTGPSLKSLVVVGGCLAAPAEFVALCLPGRGEACALTGVATGLVLLGACSYLGVAADPPVHDFVIDDAGESLQLWVSRTEAMIHWSDTTRSDWDRRVRPILARQFEMATKAKQGRTADPAAFQATGKMLFGEELWPWVDPNNVLRGGFITGSARGSLRDSVRGPATQRGPGRQTLEQILHCLEQL